MQECAPALVLLRALRHYIIMTGFFALFRSLNQILEKVTYLSSFQQVNTSPRCPKNMHFDIFAYKTNRVLDIFFLIHPYFLV